MKANIFTILVVGSLSLYGCNGGGVGSHPKSEAELRMELEMKEENNPMAYIKDSDVTLQTHQKKVRNAGLFREAEYEPDGGTIKGNIENTATLARFKDVKVKVTYYTQTETKISEEAYVIYEYFEPGKSTSFEIRVAELPSAYAKFGFEVIGATPVRQ